MSTKGFQRVSDTVVDLDNSLDTNNRLEVAVVAPGGGPIPVSVSSGAFGNNADAIVPVATGVQATDSFSYGFNGTGWDRLRTAIDQATVQGQTGYLGTVPLFSDGSTGYFRQISAAGSGDAAAGTQRPITALSLYNGATYDRLRTAAAAGALGAGDVGIAAAGILGSDGTHLRGVAVDTSGNLKTTDAGNANSTPTNVNLSGASQTLLAANANRKGAIIWNDSANLLYVLLQTGGTASATSASYKMVADATLEIPFQFTGALIGFSSAATGVARVTEITA